MKGSKILGILTALLAVLVLVTGIIGSGLKDGTGALAIKCAEASSVNDTISAHSKAAQKTAPSAVKKASSAQTSAADAVTKSEKALADIKELVEKLDRGEKLGDDVIDALRETDSEQVEGLTMSLINSRLADLLETGYKAVNSAEGKCKTAYEGIQSVYSALSVEYTAYAVSETENVQLTEISAYIPAAEKFVARAQDLVGMADSLAEDAQTAQETASKISAADSMDAQGRFLLVARDNWIGFIFTAVILLICAAVLLFFADGFVDKWRKVPVFSTGIAVLVMVIIQTYALGFKYAGVGEWLSYWFNNAMNVLRANSSVGMIALSMTFVIIAGGIDLAVGSTLAGVSTVIMCLIDVSNNGILTKLGISGLPAYLIASGAGIILGILLGTLTGTIVTKGKVPPFIVTLGMMQLIRSVAQYFTKSYTPEVPKAFQGLANTVIGGQMMLPIIYWLVLAVILHIVSKHTAFGRHVYAIGSNERTTMLSGINVNKVKMKVYILSGFVVSLAAILQVSRLRGVDVSSAGNGYEMNAIAAVVVGGTSMAGGIGSIFGTVLGVLIIGIMNNLLVLLSVDSFLSNAFTGAIVIAAVLMQRKNND